MSLSSSDTSEEVLIEFVSLEFVNPISPNNVLVKRCSRTWSTGVITFRIRFDGGSFSSVVFELVNKLDNIVKFVVGSVTI